MKLADDWHKIEKWISVTCTSVTAAVNGAWQMIGPFQQFLSQHLLTTISTSLLVIAVLSHFIAVRKSDADVSTEHTGASSHD